MAGVCITVPECLLWPAEPARLAGRATQVRKRQCWELTPPWEQPSVVTDRSLPRFQFHIILSSQQEWAPVPVPTVGTRLQHTLYRLPSLPCLTSSPVSPGITSQFSKKRTPSSVELLAWYGRERRQKTQYFIISSGFSTQKKLSCDEWQSINTWQHAGLVSEMGLLSVMDLRLKFLEFVNNLTQSFKSH